LVFCHGEILGGGVYCKEKGRRRGGKEEEEKVKKKKGSRGGGNGEKPNSSHHRWELELSSKPPRLKRTIVNIKPFSSCVVHLKGFSPIHGIICHSTLGI
jgi:hypothetical protein